MAPSSSGGSRAKEIQLRAGMGIGVYRTHSELTWDSNSLIDRDTSGAVTRHINLDLRYDITRRINVGLDMKFGSYLYDPDENNEGKSNTYAVFGFTGEFALVNRPNFRWYTGLNLHLSVLETSETDAQDDKATLRYSGGGLKLNTGVLFYFGDSNFGLNFNLGYDNHGFTLREYTLNSQEVDIDDLNGKLTASGVDLNLGLIMRFRP